MEGHTSLAKSHGPAMLLRPRGQDAQVLMRGTQMFQGYHVRAQLPGALTSVVRESGKPWVVDPDTYVFAQAPNRLLDLEKDPPVVRKGAASIALTYGRPFTDTVGIRPLDPSDFADEDVAREAVQHVLDHQRAKFKGQLGLFPDPYYDKYAIWDEDEEAQPTLPLRRILVPPYFYFKSLDDPWLEVNVAMTRHALSMRRPGELIYPILLFRPQLLGAPGVVTGIVRRYLAERVDGYLLWPDDFKEERQTPDRLKGLARMIEDLADSGQRVSKLYGGYFTALLGRNGLRGFSCGLGYGTSKKAFAYGGKPPEPRYYIPQLHRAFQFEEARGILQAKPDLMCPCPVCKDVLGRRMDHFDQMLQKGRCEYHFLTTRNAELHQIIQTTPAATADELRGAYARFPGSPSQAEYLQSWAQFLH